jgi:hypothetical protein
MKCIFENVSAESKVGKKNDTSAHGNGSEEGHDGEKKVEHGVALSESFGVLENGNDDKDDAYGKRHRKNKDEGRRKCGHKVF